MLKKLIKPKYKEFQENATLGQQSYPSHAEQKHQTISNNNLQIFVNNERTQP